MPSVWFGVGLAVLLCTALGIALEAGGAEFPQKAQELFEGCVALLATGILASMVFWMGKVARSIKSQLHDSIDAAMQIRGSLRVGTGRHGVPRRRSRRPGIGIFLIATVQQDVGIGVPIGAALGLLCAFAFGVGIYRGGVKLNLRRFFRFTGVFIIFVAAGLLAGAVHAFHEAGLWNSLQETAFDLSGILPGDGLIGTLLGGIFGYQDAPTVGEVIGLSGIPGAGPVALLHAGTSGSRRPRLASKAPRHALRIVAHVAMSFRFRIARKARRPFASVAGACYCPRSRFALPNIAARPGAFRSRSSSPLPTRAANPTC